MKDVVAEGVAGEDEEGVPGTVVVGVGCVGGACFTEFSHLIHSIM